MINTLREVSCRKNIQKANPGVNKDFPREVITELNFEEEIKISLQRLGQRVWGRGHFSRRDSLPQGKLTGARFPCGSNLEPMPHELPLFIGLIWSFQIYFHIVQWTRVRGSGIYFRINTPLGTGLASVFLGHGSIFIFRRSSQFGKIKHLHPSLSLGPGDSLFLGVLFLFWVMNLSGDGWFHWVKADSSLYPEEDLTKIQRFYT